jgi:TetR/AcrR family fatty acid metabolism transcriptional regulator
MRIAAAETERRRRILQAARHRLEHYGYEKTTMAEIAADAGMAVGSLYLHFRSKEDLLVAFAEDCQERYLRALERIASSDAPPSARLRELVRLRSLAIKEQLEATPHGGDVLLRMMRSGHACCRRMEERELGMIESILREGAARGEFQVDDPAQTARVLRAAFAGCMPPLSLGRPAGEVARDVESLYGLLLRGLRCAGAERASGPHPAAAGAAGERR